MSLPGSYSFAIQRGASFTRRFTRKYEATGLPTDLTGYKARMQVRTVAGKTGTSTADTLVLELTDGDGIAVTDAAAGEVTLTLTSAQTLALGAGNVKAKLAYGIELYKDSVSPEEVLPLLQGSIAIRPETVR